MQLSLLLTFGLAVMAVPVAPVEGALGTIGRMVAFGAGFGAAAGGVSAGFKILENNDNRREQELSRLRNQNLQSSVGMALVA